MGWMIMATHGFNDDHHWLSNGLSHVYGAMPLFTMPCICQLEYEKQTSYIWVGIHRWRFLFFSEYIGNCGLQNVDYKILLTNNSFQLIFLFSYLNSYVNIYGICQHGCKVLHKFEERLLIKYLIIFLSVFFILEFSCYYCHCTVFPLS